MLFFSPDRSENPFVPGFGTQDCSEERDQCSLIMPNLSAPEIKISDSDY